VTSKLEEELLEKRFKIFSKIILEKDAYELKE
jgi:hypothetical protein